MFFLLFYIVNHLLIPRMCLVVLTHKLRTIGLTSYN